MKPKLMDGTYTPEGTFGLIYADEAADLGGSEYIGVDKAQLASGSIAYDSVLNTYVLEESSKQWKKPDGTLIPNLEPLALFSGTINAEDEWKEGVYAGYLDPPAVSLLPKMNISVDGTLYRNVPERTITFDEEATSVYGAVQEDGTCDFSEYNFGFIGGTDFVFPTSGEHTVELSADNVTSTVLVEEQTVTIVSNNGTISGVELPEEGNTPIKITFDGVEHFVNSYDNGDGYRAEIRIGEAAPPNDVVVFENSGGNIVFHYELAATATVKMEILSQE